MTDTPRKTPALDPVRGVFLADLAHDLSTPLTAIYGALELMAGSWGSSLEDDQRALVREMLVSAREMRTIVQDVADAGALDTGRFVFAHEPVDAAALLEELRGTVHEAAAKRGVTFTLDATGARPAIDSDERRLRQVLTCLFGYAIKTSRRGSQVAATASEAGGFLRVEVRAPGIAGADPQSLFADRRDPTPGVPKPYRGPGLGLPLVGRVVHAWGGRASAEMRDGALVIATEVPL